MAMRTRSTKYIRGKNGLFVYSKAVKNIMIDGTDFNRLPILPRSLINLKIKNSWFTLDEPFKLPESLETITIEDSDFQDKHLDLTVCKNLKSVTFRNTKLTSIPDISNTNIKNLDVNGNPINLNNIDTVTNLFNNLDRITYDFNIKKINIFEKLHESNKVTVYCVPGLDWVVKVYSGVSLLKCTRKVQIYTMLKGTTGIIGMRGYSLKYNTLVMDRYTSSIDSITKENIKDTFYTLLETLNNIHNNGIIHRTISPKKLVLDTYGKVCILVSSSATVSFNPDMINEYTHDHVLPYSFSSPEIFQLERQWDTPSYDTKTDIFSLATSIKYFDKSGEFSSGEGENIIDMMLKDNPEERLSAYDALDHPYFSGYYNLLVTKKIDIYEAPDIIYDLDSPHEYSIAIDKALDITREGGKRRGTVYLFDNIMRRYLYHKRENDMNLLTSAAINIALSLTSHDFSIKYFYFYPSRMVYDKIIDIVSTIGPDLYKPTIHDLLLENIGNINNKKVYVRAEMILMFYLIDGFNTVPYQESQELVNRAIELAVNGGWKFEITRMCNRVNKIPDLYVSRVFSIDHLK